MSHSPLDGSLFHAKVKEREADILAHQKLVHIEVHRWSRRYWRARTHYDDLFQEGMLALLYAARTFDPSKGCRTFGTYARNWIRSRLHNAVVRLGPTEISRRTATKEALAVREFAVNEDMDFEPTMPAEESSKEPAELLAEFRQVLDTWYRNGRSKVPDDMRPLLVDRDLKFFVRSRFYGDLMAPLGAPYGITRQAVAMVIKRVGKLFDAWALEIREEAN